VSLNDREQTKSWRYFDAADDDDGSRSSHAMERLQRRFDGHSLLTD